MRTKRVLRQAGWRVVLLMLVGCASHQPILVGFAGELTGTRAELGVAARDGVQLAVDRINDAGGIHGRPLELVVKNDEGNPDTARQVDAELAEQGVVAIIGHITSEQTAAVFEQNNTARVVLISPTSSSSLFTGQADYFFRVMPGSEVLGESLAMWICQSYDVKQLTVIYDERNRSFAETLWQSIQTRFIAVCGDTTQTFTFVSGETDLQALIDQVKATQPEAIVFIASAVDTALMIQYGRQQNLEALLFSSSWAQTDELLQKGGQAVEGLELSATYNPQNTSPAFQEFVAQFQARYGNTPSLAATHAYEAVLVLAHALEQTGGQASGLPEALVAIEGLEGLQGKISIDKYGDVQRVVYIARVESGRFTIIATILPVD